VGIIDLSIEGDFITFRKEVVMKRVSREQEIRFFTALKTALEQSKMIPKDCMA